MTRRYPVKPKTGTMILAGLFFALCAMALFWAALTQQRGLRLWGIIEFSPSGARTFYGVLCALALLFVAFGMFAIIAHANRTVEVVIDDTTLTTPGPVWRLDASKTVQFADVTKVREQRISGQHFITLVTPTQKVWVNKGQLPDGAFDEIVAHVRERVSSRVQS